MAAAHLTSRTRSPTRERTGPTCRWRARAHPARQTPSESTPPVSRNVLVGRPSILVGRPSTAGDDDVSNERWRAGGETRRLKLVRHCELRRRAESERDSSRRAGGAEQRKGVIVCSPYRIAQTDSCVRAHLSVSKTRRADLFRRLTCRSCAQAAREASSSDATFRVRWPVHTIQRLRSCRARRVPLSKTRAPSAAGVAYAARREGA